MIRWCTAVHGMPAGHWQTGWRGRHNHCWYVYIGNLKESCLQTIMVRLRFSAKLSSNNELG